MKSIKAAFFDGPNLPCRVDEVPWLSTYRDSLTVEVCTICGSDLHTMTGRRAGPTPAILAHEIVGRVDPGSQLRAVDGTPLEPGTRVVLGVAASCGICFFCEHQLPQKCERLFKYGHEAYTLNRGPTGGLSERIVIQPGSCLVPVPDSLPREVVAPAGCATATVMAAWRKLLVESPKFIVVLGLGMLGLTACAVAAQAGCHVVAADHHDVRLQAALKFGAVAVAKPAEVNEVIQATTNGRGADGVLECSGQSEACALALELARTGGAISFVGAVAPVPAIRLAPEQFVRRCLTISGVHNYARQDLAAAVEFLAANYNAYPFQELVQASYSLSDVQYAFEIAERERKIRVAVIP